MPFAATIETPIAIGYTNAIRPLARFLLREQPATRPDRRYSSSSTHVTVNVTVIALKCPEKSIPLLQ